YYFFFQAEDGIRAFHVTGVQTCALPISAFAPWAVLLQETGAGAGGRTVGAPAPGANGGALGGGGLTPLSHRGRRSYRKPGQAQDSGGWEHPPRLRRGRARWLGSGSAVAPWAVLLH